MEILGKIFGSEAKVKIMRLFLMNPDMFQDARDVSRRTRINIKRARRELDNLAKIGLLKKRAIIKEIGKDYGRSRKKKRRKKSNKKISWVLNENFLFIKELRNLLVNSALIKEEDIISRLSRSGRLKLVILCGVFVQRWNSRIDLLVVGDKLKSKVLGSVVKGLESEIGRELQYASLETADYQYRLTMCDKLMRDVFDYPHEIILDKIGAKLVSKA